MLLTDISHNLPYQSEMFDLSFPQILQDLYWGLWRNLNRKGCSRIQTLHAVQFSTHPSLSKGQCCGQQMSADLLNVHSDPDQRFATSYCRQRCAPSQPLCFETIVTQATNGRVYEWIGGCVLYEIGENMLLTLLKQAPALVASYPV